MGIPDLFVACICWPGKASLLIFRFFISWVIWFVAPESRYYLVSLFKFEDIIMAAIGGGWLKLFCEVEYWRAEEISRHAKITPICDQTCDKSSIGMFMEYQCQPPPMLFRFLPLLLSIYEVCWLMLLSVYELFCILELSI